MREIEIRSPQKGSLHQFDAAGAKTEHAVTDAVGRAVKFVVKAGLVMIGIGFVGGALAVLAYRTEHPSANGRHTVASQVEVVEPNLKATQASAQSRRFVLDWLEERTGARIGRSEDIVARRL